jgi:disulfide bond formation protein DsbB
MRILFLQAILFWKNGQTFTVTSHLMEAGPSKNNRINKLKVEYLVTIIAFFAVSASFFAEYFLNYSPCFLCLVQRAFWIAIFISSIFVRLTPKWIIFLLLVNGCVASYHTLIYLKVIEDRCNTTLLVKHPNDYAALLKENGCSKKAWEIGKIPAPILNMTLSFTLIYFLRRR